MTPEGEVTDNNNSPHVECKVCYWVGRENELKIDRTDMYEPTALCPLCGSESLKYI